LIPALRLGFGRKCRSDSVPAILTERAGNSGDFEGLEIALRPAASAFGAPLSRPHGPRRGWEALNVLDPSFLKGSMQIKSAAHPEIEFIAFNPLTVRRVVSFANSALNQLPFALAALLTFPGRSNGRIHGDNSGSVPSQKCHNICYGSAPNRATNYAVAIQYNDIEPLLGSTHVNASPTNSTP